MFNDPRKLNQALFLPLFLQLSLWTLLFLTGCGGNAAIPSAGILASGRVKMIWHDVPGTAAYNVYLSTSPGVTVLNSYKIHNVTNPVTITDLEPGTTYYFVVEIVDESGQSWRSKERSYTISDAEAEGLMELGDIMSHSEAPAETTQIKSAPATSTSDQKSAAKSAPQQQQIKTGIERIPTKNPSSGTEADNAATRDVTLAWDDVPSATAYNIYWGEKPGVTKKTGSKIPSVQNPHKITGLTKGKTYYFVVTAVNASGESDESEEFSFTVGQ